MVLLVRVIEVDVLVAEAVSVVCDMEVTVVTVVVRKVSDDVVLWLVLVRVMVTVLLMLVNVNVRLSDVVV